MWTTSSLTICSSSGSCMSCDANCEVSLGCHLKCCCAMGIQARVWAIVQTQVNNCFSWMSFSTPVNDTQNQRLLCSGLKLRVPKLWLGFPEGWGHFLPLRVFPIDVFPFEYFHSGKGGGSFFCREFPCVCASCR